MNWESSINQSNRDFSICLRPGFLTRERDIFKTTGEFLTPRV